jgi:FkbM family methyltransferase
MGVARSVVLPLTRRALPTALSTPAGLWLVNTLHRRLTLAGKRRFFHAFGEMEYPVAGGWRLDFAGRTILLPLRREFPLSWQAATAFHGWDSEVHAFYEQLVASSRPPRLVFDVGANYGSHAIRFLVHGIQVVACEPNPVCRAYFEAWCAANGVRPEIVTAAVGDRPGTAELAVPGEATYMGTIRADVKARWRDRADVTTTKVAMITLDGFTAQCGLVPDVVKIDVEGAELAVLRGARRVLAESRPLLVFEAWPQRGDRRAIFALLSDAGYRVQPVGTIVRAWPPFSCDEFVRSPAANFLGLPPAHAG